MGRRYKQSEWEPEFPWKPIEGVETLDRVYFQQPKVLTIGTPSYQGYQSGARTYPNSNYSPSNDVIASSPVRLASSRRSGVCPPSMQPVEVVYQLSTKPSQRDLDDYLHVARSFGMDKGAIVARRFCQPWRRTQATEWGYVTYVQTNVPHSSMEFSGPFNICWFDHMKENEKAWMEDLILIHAAIPADVLEQIINSQGATTS